MEGSTVAYFIGQSVVIVGAILVSYINVKVSIAKVEAELKFVHRGMAEMKTEGSKVVDQVSGLSRVVAGLEAKGKSS